MQGARTVRRVPLWYIAHPTVTARPFHFAPCCALLRLDTPALLSGSLLAALCRSHRCCLFLSSPRVRSTKCGVCFSKLSNAWLKVVIDFVTVAIKITYCTVQDL